MVKEKWHQTSKNVLYLNIYYFCLECYKERTDSDPKAPWIPKEEFIKTESLVREMMVCFANYSNEEVRKELKQD